MKRHARALKPLRRPVVPTHCNSSGDSRASVRQWRQYYRHLRYQKAKHLPRVSWERYHLSIIFVDKTDTVRAKVAAGIFDRIANWNGYGRALYPTTAGVEPKPVEIATSAGLMAQAGLLKIPPKMFGRPGSAFEAEDLDRNDIVVAADQVTKDSLSAVACEGVPDCRDALSKVAVLADFKSYVGIVALLRTGGSALLEPELRQIVEPALAEAREPAETRSPSLTSGSQEWNAMVRDIICSSAGLVQYLIDAWPPDLPDYDPL